jgi:hypothetical protein
MTHIESPNPRNAQLSTWLERLNASRARRIAAMLTVILVPILIYYHLTLFAAESYYTERGSYPYYVLIRKLVRDLPLYQLKGDLQYFSSVGDGPKPPEEAVFYCSRGTRQDIASFYGTYMQANGFATALTDDQGVRYRRGHQTFLLSIESEVGCLRVHLGLVERV